MGANGDPEKVAMDKSGTNKAAIDAINAGRELPILVRQVKYLNNIVEQDHRAIKRVTRPMLNFKSFRSAGAVLAGIEFMHMIRILHNVEAMTGVLKEMQGEGLRIDEEILAGLAPYRTEHINRYGDYTLDLERKLPPMNYKSRILQ
jgi:hypothetical protein